MLAVLMQGIHKRFGQVVANDDVTLAVRPGGIHAVVGENGAGKTTLMQILYGLLQPDAGEIFIFGQHVHLRSPRVAIAHRIGMVHQHFKLVPSLSVAQNICLGDEPVSRFGLFDQRAARDRAAELSARYGLQVDPDARLSSLSVGLQQRVEILKVLSRGAEIIILDEPTAILTPSEADRLFETLSSMAEQGRTIIFITHKLREVLAISRTVTVLRQGRTVATLPSAETSERELASLMVGREVFLTLDKPPRDTGEPILEVKGLRVADARGVEKVRGVSLTVRQGEIVTVAGVEGNGQTELIEAITGLRQPQDGVVEVGGADISRWSVRQRRDSMMAHVPEDRIKSAVAIKASLALNAVLGRHHRAPVARGAWIDYRRAEQLTAQLIDRYRVTAAGVGALAGSMSGGNLQKLIVGRELSYDVPLMVVAQPTRGVDVGSLELIHEELLRKRQSGHGILVVSTDLDEVFLISDRILVMYNGEIVGEFRPTDATREEVGLCMTGTRPGPGARVEDGATARGPHLEG